MKIIILFFLFIIESKSQEYFHYRIAEGEVEISFLNIKDSVSSEFMFGDIANFNDAKTFVSIKTEKERYKYIVQLYSEEKLDLLKYQTIKFNLKNKSLYLETNWNKIGFHHKFTLECSYFNFQNNILIQLTYSIKDLDEKDASNYTDTYNFIKKT